MNLGAAYSAERFGMLINAATRKMDRIRPGKGIDSHAAVTRFLGVSSGALMGSRLPDTGFTQYGAQTRINWAPSANDQFVVQRVFQVQERAGDEEPPAVDLLDVGVDAALEDIHRGADARPL